VGEDEPGDDEEERDGERDPVADPPDTGEQVRHPEIAGGVERQVDEDHPDAAHPQELDAVDPHRRPRTKNRTNETAVEFA